MKRNHVIMLYWFLLISLNSNAQMDKKNQLLSLSSTEKVKLNKFVKNYKAFSLDRSKIIEGLRQNKSYTFSLNLDEIDNWEINLELNDLRSEKYVAKYRSDSDEFEFKKYFPNTFKGKTEKGKTARFTIDDRHFDGAIIDEYCTKLFRQAKAFDSYFSEDVLLVFDKNDVVESSEDFSTYLSDAVELSESVLKNIDMLEAQVCTYYLEIATDADYEYYQDMNCNLGDTFREIFSVLNIVEGVYESSFDLRFVVSFQNVWTTSTDPYTSSIPLTLLNQFLSEWNTNRTNVTRDIAHLFTGRNMSGLGIAVRGQINTSSAYAISKNRTEMFETTAHEIGHNLNALDNPSDGNCLTSTASVMCQGTKDNNLWFSENSISEITSFLLLHTNDLNNPISSELNLTDTITGFKAYLARDKITSTQSILGGVIIYKSDEIILNGGFEVNCGAEFEMSKDTFCNLQQ